MFLSKNRVYHLSYIFIVLTINLFSCGTVVKFPTNRFSTSESKGAGRGSLDLSFNGAYKVKVAEDYAATPIVHQGKITKSNTFTNDIAVGLNDLLDFEISMGKSIPLMLATKIQLLGDPEVSAKGGNFSLALRLGYGFFTVSDEIKDKQRKVSASATNLTVEGLIGYRIIDPLLIYAGYYIDSYNARATISKDHTDKVKGSGKQKGFHLGVAYRYQFLQIKLNIAKVQNTYNTGPLTEEDLFFGLSLGLVY